MTDSEDFNLFSHFKDNFEQYEDKELLRTESDRSLTYRAVDELSGRMASGLAALGASPGDRISVQVDKSPECLCLYLACLRGGYVFHPLNTAYRRAELEFFLGDAEPAIVVCDPGAQDEIESLTRDLGVGRVLTLDATGGGTLMEEASRADADSRIVERDADDLASLLYSSGTTGVPKGIMLSHANLLSNTETLVTAWGFTADDRLLHALPIYHVHGLFVALGCVLLSGASMRWLPRFDAETVIRRLPECTVMMGVPTFYTRLLASPGFTKETASHTRVFISGSAPLRAETFAEFESRTGHRILERYGMTETNMNTSNPLEGVRKPGTVGPPLPGVDARVCDDQGRALAVGEIGNLQVRGPNVFRGYWKLPEKTAEEFTSDGFFNTGDQATIDTDGYVSIVGRAKDMVITGGLNVYPKEIEQRIDELPGVKESAVIGVQHPDLGEAVVAVVVKQDDALDANTLIETLKRDMAGFKVPKRILFVDELPRNTMAKIQKNRLRDQYASLFSEDGTGGRVTHGEAG